jgi:hypothetical protein
MGKSMRELREGDNLKSFVDPRIVEALGHPVRAHILAVLNERVASGKEIGEELGADVSTFFHHIEHLERLDCVERVHSRRVRGAAEHFFRAKQTLLFDDAAWSALPESLRADLQVNALQRLVDDAVAAIEAKTFSGRDETSVSWLSGSFDVQGWREATAVLGGALRELMEVHERAKARLASGEGEPLRASIGVMAFEVPAPGPAVPDG